MSKKNVAKIALTACVALSIFSCQGLKLGDITIGQGNSSTSSSVKDSSISFKTLEKGLQSGIKLEKNYTIQTEEEFTTFWKDHTSNKIPAPEMPKIDFKKSTVIGVFAGPTSGDSKLVEITKIDTADKKVTVNTKISTRDGAIAAMTYPFHLIATDQKIDKPIDFITVTGKEEPKPSATPTGTALTYEKIKSGADGCISEQSNFVINDAAKWSEIFLKNVECQPVDAKCGGKCMPKADDVDFANYTVLAIFGGDKVNGCDPKITIDTISEGEKEVAVNIYIPKADPAIECVRMVKAPYFYAAVPKIKKDVKFYYVDTPAPTPTPSVAPTDAPSPSSLTFKEISKATRSLIKDYREATVSTKDDYLKLWKELSGSELLPAEVNFEKEMVVGLFLGTRSSGGYSVKIDKVDYASNEITVYATESIPGPDKITTMVITYPYVMATVEKRADAKVKFVVNKVAQ